MTNSSHRASLFWIVSSVTLLFVSLILGGAMVYRMYFEAPIPEVVAPETDNPVADIDLDSGDSADAFVDDEMPSAEEADESDERWASYNSRGIIFEYPESWHIYGEFIYSDPFDFTVYLNDRPLEVVDPRGGPALYGDVVIQSFATGDAYLAPYENIEWEVYEESQIMLGGREVTQLQLVMDPAQAMDLAYVPSVREVLFFFGDEVSYEVTYIPEEDDFEDPVWLRMKESFRFTENANAIVQ